MAAIDYAEIAAIATELISDAGREVTLYKLSATAADPLKPWRGPGTQTRTDPVTAKAVFVVPNTSIPTESRGLGFDWISDDLLRRARHVCIIAAKDLPILDDYKIAVDFAKDWTIIWGQCLQPGGTRLIYVFGLAQ